MATPPTRPNRQAVQKNIFSKICADRQAYCRALASGGLLRRTPTGEAPTSGSTKTTT